MMKFALTFTFIFLICSVAFTQEKAEPDRTLENSSIYMNLLEKPIVQGQLELTADQFLTLKRQAKLMQKRKLEFHLVSKKHSYDTKELTRLGLRQAFLKDIGKIVGVIDEQLLPHQKTRVKQVAWQRELSARSRQSVYLAKKFEEEVDLSAEQKAEIQEIANERDFDLKKETERYLKKVKEIRQKSSDKITNDVLTDEQRAKATKLFGPIVDLNPGSTMFSLMREIQKDAEKRQEKK